MRYAASALLAFFFCQSLRAECLGEHIGRDGKYPDLIYAQPQVAITDLKAAVAGARPDPARPNQLAGLYAILATAYAWDNQPYRAADAIQKGLASLNDRNDLPLRQRFELFGTWLLDSMGQTRLALERYEQLAQSVSPSAPYYICVLIDRAYLRTRNGRFSAALTDLLGAYQMSRDSGNSRDRAEISSTLGRLYSSVDFYEEALYYSGEAIALYERIGRRGLLAQVYLNRAFAHRQRGAFGKAEADLLRARELGRETNDAYYQLFSNSALCEVRRLTGRLPDARRACDEADGLARQLDDPEGGQLAHLTRSELLLALRRPAEALAQLALVTSKVSTDIPREYWPRIYMVRAQAYAATGQEHQAYLASQRYIARLGEDNELSGAEKIAAYKVKLEMDRKDQALLIARQGEALLVQRVKQTRQLYQLLVAGLLLAAMAGLAFAILSRKRLVAVRAQRDAEQRLDAVGKLAGGIAHDFNNLMTVVQQAAGLLARHPAIIGCEDAQGLVTETRLAATTGGAITRQLLAFAGQLELRPEPIRLDVFLKEIRPMLERAAGDSVALEVACPESGATAWVDRAQLTTTLINLVSNARDALTGPGVVRIHARAASRDERQTHGFRGEAACIEVTDTGGGMEPDVLRRAVEPFFSTKGAASGSGLGLSVVDGFVKQSAGKLSIDSHVGRGTSVTMWLPAIRSES